MTDINKLIDAAAAEEDQSITQTAGDFVAPKPGLTVCRFIDYIELGLQKQQPYQGQPKAPAEMVKLTFELLSPLRDIKEFDGKKRADQISIKCRKSLSNRAKFKRLFNAMDYGRGKKHMAQFLGEAFLVTVFNYETKDKKVRASVFNADGVCGIAAPFRPADPLVANSKPTPIKVPPALSPIRVFIFNHPTMETWASLFIDGTRDVKDASGKVTGKASKNYIQEMIMKATNYPGSPLEAMLAAVSTPQVPTPAQSAADAAPIQAAASDAAQAASTAVQAGRDALAALGF